MGDEGEVKLDTYASMDLLRGHLSILAWNLMLAICKLRLSLSMACSVSGEMSSTPAIWPLVTRLVYTG